MNPCLLCPDIAFHFPRLRQFQQSTSMTCPTPLDPHTLDSDVRCSVLQATFLKRLHPRSSQDHDRTVASCTFAQQTPIPLGVDNNVRSNQICGLHRCNYLLESLKTARCEKVSSTGDRQGKQSSHPGFMASAEHGMVSETYPIKHLAPAAAATAQG